MPAKLLIVDDEELLTASLKDYFEMKDFVVSIAATGQDAIRLLKEEKPDIILLDLLLKGKLDGLDVLKEAKASSPQSKVIMVTGSDTIEKEKEIKRIGVSRYLQKPVTVNKLLDTVNEVLAGK